LQDLSKKELDNIENVVGGNGSFGSVLFNLSNSYLLKMQKQEKSFAKININGSEYLVFFNHDLVNEITINNSKSFVKGLKGFPLRRIMGNGILTSDGKIHLRDRRIIQPAFSKKNMEKYLKIFVSKIKQQISLWNNNDKVDFYAASTELLLAIISESLFSSDLSKLDNFNKIKNLLIDKEQIKNISKSLQDIVNKREKNQFKNGDVLDILINNKDHVFSEKELKDHLATLIFSGYMTNLSLLSWSIFLISQNKEILKDLQDEADSCLWIQENRPPHLEEIHDNYEISKKIIKETLRLYPPVWFLMRQATEDVDLSSIMIPKGSNILICQYVLHRDKNIFDSPETWNPYRWTKDFEKGLPKGSYIPFGQGSRQCIGYDFAIAETQMILLLMAKNFSWESLNKKAIVDVSPSTPLDVSILLKKR
jgi:cytochrome P450